MAPPMELAAIPEDYERGVKYAAIISEVLAKFPLKPVPVKLYPRGLADVAEGLEYMRSGKVCEFGSKSRRTSFSHLFLGSRGEIDLQDCRYSRALTA